LSSLPEDINLSGESQLFLYNFDQGNDGEPISYFKTQKNAANFASGCDAMDLNDCIEEATTESWTPSVDSLHSNNGLFDS
jgi:hypothetical protein